MLCDDLTQLATKFGARGETELRLRCCGVWTMRRVLYIRQTVGGLLLVVYEFCVM